jgi:hypothetical protein
LKDRVIELELLQEQLSVSKSSIEQKSNKAEVDSEKEKLIHTTYLLNTEIEKNAQLRNEIKILEEKLVEKLLIATLPISPRYLKSSDSVVSAAIRRSSLTPRMSFSAKDHENQLAILSAVQSEVNKKMAENNKKEKVNEDNDTDDNATTFSSIGSASVALDDDSMNNKSSNNDIKNIVFNEEKSTDESSDIINGKEKENEVKKSEVEKNLLPVDESAILNKEPIKEIIIEETAEEKKIRKEKEALQKEILLKNKNATTIQKIVRSFLARCRVKQIKYHIAATANGLLMAFKGTRQGFNFFNIVVNSLCYFYQFYLIYYSERLVYLSIILLILN